MKNKFKLLYFYYIFKSARPLQWLKNLAIFATLIFRGFLFYQPKDSIAYFWVVSYAFLIFCLLTSAVYLLNDVFDKESDKKHPFKKNRPIASGDLPIKVAIIAIIVLIGLVAFLSTFFSNGFRILLVIYFVLQIIYAKKLKDVPILDVFSIALGFLIRVYIGAVAVNLHMSVWFLLTTLSAALFLAVGKRQGELTMFKSMKINPTRTTLKHYNQRLLDQYTSMFATASWLSYALFTFQNEVGSGLDLFNIYSVLPKTFHSQKLLMASVPFVIFGIMRYLELIYENNEGESPEKILIKDKTLLTIVICFFIIVLATIYVF